MITWESSTDGESVVLESSTVLSKDTLNLLVELKVQSVVFNGLLLTRAQIIDIWLEAYEKRKSSGILRFPTT